MFGTKREHSHNFVFQDIHFIIDTAECIIRTVKDESLLMRMKAAWSLGNLSEALVHNVYV
jgi:hypothetical protein